VRSIRWTWLLLAVALGFGGCSDDGEPAAPSTTATPALSVAMVDDACGRLAGLGRSILSAQSVGTTDAIVELVEEPFADFAEGADALGDEELAELAQQAQERFDVYLTADDPLVSREAADDADIVLDRSIQRCVELGSSVEFPRQPS
jgi:hypothetical protein